MRRPTGTPGTRSPRYAWIVARLFLAALIFIAASPAAFAGTLDDARRLFDAGQYQQAVNALLGALEQRSQDARVYHWLGRCYFELRSYDRAISHGERAVALDPGNSDHHLWLGRAYGRKAEQAGWFSGLSLAGKTRREFEEAVRLNPSNFPAQHDLIEFYLEAPGIVGGGEDKARRQVEAVAAVDAVEGHVVRGKFWMDRKKPELAEQEFRQVMAAKPKRTDPYFGVAEFYQKRNDAARMEEAVEAASSVDSSDRRLNYYCGVVRVLAGNRLDEAERCLKVYLATVPDRSDLPSHADGHEWLGRLYERQGKCSAAAEQYRKALETEARSKHLREALRRAEKCPPGK